MNYEADRQRSARRKSRFGILAMRTDRRCRFCEANRPSSDVSRSLGPALPASLGNESLVSFEICDDCHAQHVESVGNHLDRFVAAIRRGDLRDPLPRPGRRIQGAGPSGSGRDPRTRITVLRGRDRVGRQPRPRTRQPVESAAWTATSTPCPSRRRSPGSLWPAGSRTPTRSLTCSPSSGRRTSSSRSRLPLCVRDEDLEVSWIVPRAASPFGVGRGPIESRSFVVPLASAGTRLAFAGF